MKNIHRFTLYLESVFPIKKNKISHYSNNHGNTIFVFAHKEKISSLKRNIQMPKIYKLYKIHINVFIITTAIMLQSLKITGFVFYLLQFLFDSHTFYSRNFLSHRTNECCKYILIVVYQSNDKILYCFLKIKNRHCAPVKYLFVSQANIYEEKMAI